MNNKVVDTKHVSTESNGQKTILRAKYEALESTSLIRNRGLHHRNYTQDEIRADVNKLFEQTKQSKLLLSAIAGTLKTTKVRYSTLTYTEVRSALLYKKEYELTKDSQERVWVMKYTPLPIEAYSLPQTTQAVTQTAKSTSTISANGASAEEPYVGTFS